jgi:hypothetical protein
LFSGSVVLAGGDGVTPPPENLVFNFWLHCMKSIVNVRTDELYLCQKSGKNTPDRWVQVGEAFLHRRHDILVPQYAVVMMDKAVSSSAAMFFL